MHELFTDGDRRRLAAAAKTTREARLFRRVQAVRLVAEGASPTAAARAVGAGRRSAYGWCRAYLEGGRRPAALAERPRAGRPRKAATEQSDARLEGELARAPKDCGLQAAGWTAALLAAHLGRTFGGGRLSARSVRRRLKALGWRWKRPRYVFAPPEPNLPQKKGVSCDA